MYFNSKFNKVAHKSGGVGVLIAESLKNEIDSMNCSDHCKDCGTLCNIPNMLWILLGNVLFILQISIRKGQFMQIMICLIQFHLLQLT